MTSSPNKIWQILYEIAAFAACFLLIWLACATLKTCGIFANFGIEFANRSVAHILPAVLIMLIVLAIRLGQRFLTTKTALQRAESNCKSLRHRLNNDEATGLPNRNYVDQQLQQFALGKSNYQINECAIVAVQLGHLQAISVTHGKKIATEVVAVVVERLKRVVGSTCISRIEDDRFLLVLTEDAAPNVDNCLKKISQSLRSPLSVKEIAFQLDCAIGVALYPKNSTNMRLCVEHAEDALLYGLKKDPNAISLFTQSIADHKRKEAAFEKQLRDAVMRDELILFYQPYYDMATGKAAGFEALARWTAPDGRQVPPSEFIPIIEKLGLSAELTFRLFQKAAAEATSWPSDMILAFNVCGTLFEDTASVDKLIGIAAHQGVDLNRVEFEVTETRLIGDCTTAIQNIKRLRELGARIALDDLGTGYSSLLRLSHIDIDKVKIDREFTLRMLDDPRTAKIVASMVSMSRELDIAVSIEGIETEEHLARARALRCDYAQGFLMGRPRDAAAARSVLDQKTIAIALPRDEARLAV